MEIKCYFGVNYPPEMEFIEVGEGWEGCSEGCSTRVADEDATVEAKKVRQGKRERKWAVFGERCV